MSKKEKVYKQFSQNNSRYRKKKWRKPKGARPDTIEYVRKSLGMENMHPAKRLKMVKTAIAETYFKGYDITFAEA